MKGETSGHTQKIKNIFADCDYDTLLFIVEQKGNVCHTGKDTCFHHKFRR
jgi:phosphoribosyl-AMP cyclohydrolase